MGNCCRVLVIVPVSEILYCFIVLQSLRSENRNPLYEGEDGNAYSDLSLFPSSISSGSAFSGRGVGRATSTPDPALVNLRLLAHAARVRVPHPPPRPPPVSVTSSRDASRDMEGYLAMADVEQVVPPQVRPPSSGFSANHYSDYSVEYFSDIDSISDYDSDDVFFPVFTGSQLIYPPRINGLRRSEE